VRAGRAGIHTKPTTFPGRPRRHALERRVITDLDIWRAVNLLTRRYGANAELEVAKHADLMLDRGDDVGRHLGARSSQQRLMAVILQIFLLLVASGIQWIGAFALFVRCYEPMLLFLAGAHQSR
jgi:hypothetical protein